MSQQPATMGPAPATVAPVEQPVVPGYEILSELGRGGMGVIYRARQVSSQQLVALKLIRDSALASEEDRARFRIEAEAAARMQHPNIVRIYEVGEHQGRPYLAMELVEGGSLDQRLAGRPRPALEAARLVRLLALAVEHAHAQQVVHRDLKPANVLLANACVAEEEQRRDDVSSLQPKIADFGLAKRLDSQSTAWTRDGAVLGTASYMAPEQAAGRVRDISPALDVYALGAILYEVLTGRPPFKAESFNEIVQQVLHDEPTQPSRLKADVPGDLETICLKCLEKEPGRRYAAASELADDLQRFLSNQPVKAVQPTPAERLARRSARDSYQIIGEIGRGPRSTVYQAMYEPLQQPVALKVFQAGIFTREEWDSRWRRGTELRNALHHPHIVAVYRAGWWDDVPYLAVEYVAQGSVAGRTEPYPLKPALRVVEQVAEVLSYIHRQGFAHGNLKPSNVLLAADGIPRLADFQLTSGLFTGALPREDCVGLAYLAPELLSDPSVEPRPNTDVYGLGIILYELLTGRPPFAGTSGRETLERVRSEEPVPPSRINAEVPFGVESLCLRCLRKNPWTRYRRAYDVSKRLRSFLEEAR
jgi:serine/threonine protein kinase